MRAPSESTGFELARLVLTKSEALTLLVDIEKMEPINFPCHSATQPGRKLSIAVAEDPGVKVSRYLTLRDKGITVSVPTFRYGMFSSLRV